MKQDLSEAIKSLKEKIEHDENAWDKVLCLIGDLAREILELKARVRRLENGHGRRRKRV